MRALDEVAEAIQLARHGGPPVISAFGLHEQFGGPPTPKQWREIRRHLACGLPPLEFVQGHYFLPDGFSTIWPLVVAAAAANPDWKWPTDCTESAWREAQIFVRVRQTLVDALGVDTVQVTRKARLMRDLGAS